MTHTRTHVATCDATSVELLSRLYTLRPAFLRELSYLGPCDPSMQVTARSRVEELSHHDACQLWRLSLRIELICAVNPRGSLDPKRDIESRKARLELLG